MFISPVHAPQGILANTAALYKPPPHLASQGTDNRSMGHVLAPAGTAQWDASDPRVPSCSRLVYLAHLVTPTSCVLWKTKNPGLCSFSMWLAAGAMCSPRERTLYPLASLSPGMHTQGPGRQVQAARSAGGTHAAGAEVPPAAQGKADSLLTMPSVNGL